MTRFFGQLQEKLAALPGVRSVTASSIGIIGDGNSGSTFRVTGRAQEKDPVRVRHWAWVWISFRRSTSQSCPGTRIDADDTAAGPSSQW